MEFLLEIYEPKNTHSPQNYTLKIVIYGENSFEWTTQNFYNFCNKEYYQKQLKKSSKNTSLKDLLNSNFINTWVL